METLIFRWKQIHCIIHLILKKKIHILGKVSIQWLRKQWYKKALSWIINVVSQSFNYSLSLFHLSQDCTDDAEESYRSRIRSVLRNPTDSSNGASNNPMRCESLTMREKCIAGINCFTYSWNATEWSPCQLEAGRTCGIGTRDRLLQCLRSDGRIVEVTKCEEVRGHRSYSYRDIYEARSRETETSWINKGSISFLVWFWARTSLHIKFKDICNFSGRPSLTKGHVISEWTIWVLSTYM